LERCLDYPAQKWYKQNRAHDRFNKARKIEKLEKVMMTYAKALCVLPRKGTTAKELENEVVVTRKGQTTIPAKLRLKYRIEEGTRLEVIETEEGILFRPKKSTVDLAGSGAEYATPDEMKKLLDRLREEDV